MNTLYELPGDIEIIININISWKWQIRLVMNHLMMNEKHISMKNVFIKTFIESRISNRSGATFLVIGPCSLHGSSFD